MFIGKTMYVTFPVNSTHGKNHQYGFSSLEQTIGNFATFTTVVISVILLLEIWLNMEHTWTAL
jgi:hypothetical protein